MTNQLSTTASTYKTGPAFLIWIHLYIQTVKFFNHYLTRAAYCLKDL